MVIHRVDRRRRNEIVPEPTVGGATLCYLRKEGRILLQLKAQDRFGGGRWNGPGGKILPGETPEEAIRREVEEETGLQIHNPVYHGVLTFIFKGDPSHHLLVHVYSTSRFTGDVRGGAEGRLRWYSERSLPFDRMWPDDRHWVPAVLDGATLEGRVYFDATGDKLLRWSLRLCWEDPTSQLAATTE
jgi:8-oxo-dGTP diphosphatase